MSERRKIFREGEFYLVDRDGRYAVHGMWNGKRIRRSCKTDNLERAKLALFNVRREYETGFNDDYDNPDKEWRAVAEFAWKRAAHSAGHRAIPFSIKASDIYRLMEETDFRCSVSGIPLAKRVKGDGKRDPWAPSIDRIQSCHGYTFDNVRVVCLAANYAMNQWGIDVLLRLSKGVIRSALTVSREEQIPEKSAHKLTPNVSEIYQEVDLYEEK